MSLLDGWRHCPRCTTVLEQETGRVRCPACGFVAYANPAATACALVTDDDGRLLLGRRADEPFNGLWDTPGGFVEEGEHPLDALRRELREETGLEVEPGGFVGVWMDLYGDGPGAASTLNLYWEARVLGGELRAADDVAELAWFAPSDLPARAELAFTTVVDALGAWRAASVP
jgi:ADP-ribose pyrophosphatase YjhB (NUDIX family)